MKGQLERAASVDMVYNRVLCNVGKQVTQTDYAGQVIDWVIQKAGETKMVFDTVGPPKRGNKQKPRLQSDCMSYQDLQTNKTRMQQGFGFLSFVQGVGLQGCGFILERFGFFRGFRLYGLRLSGLSGFWRLCVVAIMNFRIWGRRP